MEYNDFSNSERQLKLSDIDEIENRLSFRFPKSIKEHYMMFNGGAPERYVFKASDTFYIIQELFPIKYGTKGDRIEDAYQDLVIDRKIVPNNLVPFASDPGGDFYCFSIEAGHEGEIYMFRGEYVLDKNQGITFLAPDIEQFVGNMMDEPEEFY